MNLLLALLKAQVKGFYRRNPKTGKREWVKPHSTRRERRMEAPGKRRVPKGPLDKYGVGVKPRGREERKPEKKAEPTPEQARHQFSDRIASAPKRAAFLAKKISGAKTLTEDDETAFGNALIRLVGGLGVAHKALPNDEKEKRKDEYEAAVDKVKSIVNEAYGKRKKELEGTKGEKPEPQKPKKTAKPKKYVDYGDYSEGYYHLLVKKIGMDKAVEAMAAAGYEGGDKAKVRAELQALFKETGVAKKRLANLSVNDIVLGLEDDNRHNVVKALSNLGYGPYAKQAKKALPLRKGVVARLREKPAEVRLDTPARVRAAIASFSRNRGRYTPAEQVPIWQRLIKAAGNFDIEVSEVVIPRAKRKKKKSGKGRKGKTAKHAEQLKGVGYLYGGGQNK